MDSRAQRPAVSLGRCACRPRGIVWCEYSKITDDLKKTEPVSAKPQQSGPAANSYFGWPYTSSGRPTQPLGTFACGQKHCLAFNTPRFFLLQLSVQSQQVCTISLLRDKHSIVWPCHVADGSDRTGI